MSDCYKSAYETAEENKQRRNEFLTQVLGGKPEEGETWVRAMAKKYATRHYPEATDTFIAMNALIMAQQLENEYTCEHCTGRRLTDCPTCGYLTYLRIDKDSGCCIPLADSEKCGRVLIALPNSDGANKTGYRKGGGGRG